VSGAYDPEWIFSLPTVTPKDIRKAVADAKAAGGDAEELDVWLQRAIEGAGGTIEQLAAKWSMKNRLAALHAQLERKRDRRTRRPGAG
jgi:hypothetical protein